MNDKWLKQYKENYEGKSDEAKEVAEYLKETYNGASYIPWATMERLTYMQDPDAKFETILNKICDGNDGLIHTDSFINGNSVENKEGIVNRTEALVVSHFVKVSCTFLGKTFIEEYPIQEQDYSAAKIYNQNLVNKALKRALAKVASRATGIGLKLYENKDLQFEEDKEEKKPEVKKTTKTKKVEEPKVVENVVEIKSEDVTVSPMEVTNTTEIIENNTSYSQEIVNLCNIIKTSDTEKMSKVLQNVNVSILKQYGFVLKQDDTDEELCEKLSNFKSIETFTKAIKNMLGE